MALERGRTGLGFSNPLYGYIEVASKSTRPIPVPKPRLRRAQHLDHLETTEDLYANVQEYQKRKSVPEYQRSISKSLSQCQSMSDIIDHVASLVKSFERDPFVSQMAETTSTNESTGNRRKRLQISSELINLSFNSSNTEESESPKQLVDSGGSDSGRWSKISGTPESISTSSIENIPAGVSFTPTPKEEESKPIQEPGSPELPPRKPPRIEIPNKPRHHPSHMLKVEHLHQSTVCLQRSGYLWKTGPNFKSFKHRWCILYRHSSNYYDANFSYYFNRTSMSVSLSGKIMMTDVQFMSVVESIPSKTRLPKVEKNKQNIDNNSLSFLEIGVRSRQGRVFLLAARTASDRQEWMHAFSQSLTLHSFQNKELYHFGFIQVKFTITAKWQTCFALLSKDRYLYVMELNNYNGSSGERMINCKMYHMFNLRKTIRIGAIDEKSNTTSGGSVANGFSLTQNGGYVIYIRCEFEHHINRWYQSVMRFWKTPNTPETLTIEEQYLTKDNVPVAIDKCLKFLDTFTQTGAVNLFTNDGSNSRHNSANSISHYVLPAAKGSTRSQSLKSRHSKSIQPKEEEDSGAKLLNELCYNAWNVHLLPQKHTANQISLLMLQYLRLMNECIFTEWLLPYWLQVIEDSDVDAEQRGHLLKKLLQLLPAVNYATLRRVVIFLSNFGNFHHSVSSSLCKALVFSKQQNSHTIVSLSTAETLLTTLVNHCVCLFEVTKDEVEKEMRIKRVVHLIQNTETIDRQHKLGPVNMKPKRKASSPGSLDIKPLGSKVNPKEVHSLIIGIKVCVESKSSSIVNVHLSRETTAKDVEDMIRQKIKLNDAECSYSLFEILCFRRLERLVKSGEKVLSIVLCWSDWPSHWSAEACLEFKSIDRFLCTNCTLEKPSTRHTDSVNYSLMLMAVIRYCPQADTRMAKKVLAEFSNDKLVLYCKESHQLIGQHYIDDIYWYVGIESGNILQYATGKHQDSAAAGAPVSASPVPPVSDRKGSGDCQVPALTFVDKNQICMRQCNERINFGQTLLFSTWNELSQWCKGLYQSGMNRCR